jgi:hypothetical protein
MHRLSHQNLKCGVIAVVHAKITGNGEVFNFIKGNNNARNVGKMNNPTQLALSTRIIH